VVFYTAAALTDFDGADDQTRMENLRSAVKVASTQTNTALSASQIDTAVNIVGVEQTNMRETGDSGNDLDAMLFGDGGRQARQRRNALKADVVALIVRGGNMDGIAYGLSRDAATDPTTEQNAGFVINNTCVAARWMCFAHEFGHVLGAAHDDGNVDYPGYYDDARGWTWSGDAERSDSICYGDLMQYRCATNRALVYSNPNVNDRGKPTGKRGAADNARAMQAGAKFVANYRVAP